MAQALTTLQAMGSGYGSVGRTVASPVRIQLSSNLYFLFSVNR